MFQLKGWGPHISKVVPFRGGVKFPKPNIFWRGGRVFLWFTRFEIGENRRGGGLRRFPRFFTCFTGIQELQHRMSLRFKLKKQDLLQDRIRKNKYPNARPGAMAPNMHFFPKEKKNK